MRRDTGCEPEVGLGLLSLMACCRTDQGIPLPKPEDHSAIIVELESEDFSTQAGLSMLVRPTDPFASLLAESFGKLACMLINDNQDLLWSTYTSEIASLRAEIKRLKDERRMPEGQDTRKKVSINESAVGKQVSINESVVDTREVRKGAALTRFESDPGRMDAFPTVEMERHKSNFGVPLCEYEDLGRNSVAPVVGGLEELDLHIIFQRMSVDNKHLDIEHLIEHCIEDDASDARRNEMREQFKAAVHQLNIAVGVLASPEAAKHGYINFFAFRTLMMSDPSELKDQLSEDSGDTWQSLLTMRDMLIQETMVDKIAKACRVAKRSVSAEREVESTTKTVLAKWLEPVVGAMIVANSLTLGLSLDWGHEWTGWDIMEFYFTGFFLLELFLKIWIDGYWVHFCGEERLWNWFDFLIVIVAVFDSWMTFAKMADILKTEVDVNSLTVLRLARLIRITRLVRLMRLKMFKELTLMVNGVIAGLRTLFWAMVMLLVFVYALGILMRQVMGPEFLDGSACNYVEPVNDTAARRALLSPAQLDCRRSVATVEKYGNVLFGDISRSMLTVFNCFTDGCNAPDGTPLIWHLWEISGPLMVALFILSYLFVTFGVLNLIMAVFVENTLASAQKLDGERQFGKHEDHVIKAHRLQQLLHKLVQGEMTTPQSKRSMLGSLRRMWSKGQIDEKHEVDPSCINMRISQDAFETMLLDSQVQNLLDDLDISSISREQLFDILDADGNGYLSISELVDGIMKLRGPADKGDVISTGLMVRCVQKAIRKLEGSIKSHAELLSKMDKDMAKLHSRKNTMGDDLAKLLSKKSIRRDFKI